jgi:multisubunit Na+/H+ antiporter MnhB subunit
LIDIDLKTSISWFSHQVFHPIFGVTEVSNLTFSKITIFDMAMETSPLGIEDYYAAGQFSSQP